MTIPTASAGSSARGILFCVALVLSACNREIGYGGRSSRDWIRSLSDSSTRARTLAADALGRILEIQPKSPRVVQALIGALADSVDEVRMAAATALVAEGVRAEGAITGVHAALHDSAHAHVRSHAALILGSLGPSAGEGAVPALIEALVDPVPQVRAYAAEALGKFGQAAVSAVPTIVSHLSDSSSNARLKMLEALFNIRAPDSVIVPAFRNALSDPEASIRAAAAYMLGGIRAAAAPALDALVVVLGDEDPTVRSAALRDLGDRARGAPHASADPAHARGSG